MKKLIMLLFATAALVSCEHDDPIYTGEGNAKGYVSLPATTFELPVVIDTDSVFQIPVYVSSLSDTDRVFDIEFIPQEDPSLEANIENYDLPDTVTIPAGEYVGTLEITAEDISIESSERFISFRIDEENTELLNFEDETYTLSLFQICPVPPTFLVGTYDIGDVVATIGPANGTENIAAGTYEVTATSPTTREFTAAVLPAFRPTPVPIVLNLVCNEIRLGITDPGGLSCNGGASDYVFGPAGNPTLYDVENGTDDFFIVEYTEDPNGSCGGPFASSFFMQKL
jgi:hypothetical protein